MAKMLKFKYVVAFMIAIVLITSVSLFSVSYSKWTGGKTQLSASVNVGEWEAIQLNGYYDEVGKSIATQTVKLLYENLDDNDKSNFSEVVGNNPTTQLGGVIAADGTVKAAAWVNKGTKPYGYTTEPIKFEAGDTFIVVAFNKVLDPTNNGKKEYQDAYIVLPADKDAGNTSSGKTATYAGGSGNDRIVFTATKSGYYTIDVHENEGRGWWGNKDNQYVVSITYSETAPQA